MTTIAPAVDCSSKGMAASMPATVAMTSISRLRRHDSSSMLWASALTLATKMSRPPSASAAAPTQRSEEHTSELQSRSDLVCRLLLEKKKQEGERGRRGREREKQGRT